MGEDVYGEEMAAFLDPEDLPDPVPAPQSHTALTNKVTLSDVWLIGHFSMLHL